MLLSLQDTYPPAFQLALDMLKRVSTANDEIIDVLLSKGQLLAALRFVRSLGPDLEASVSARRFLDAAFGTNDYMLFFSGALRFQSNAEDTVCVFEQTTIVCHQGTSTVEKRLQNQITNPFLVTLIFLLVYKFFEQRNMRLRKSVEFVTDEGCDRYVHHFRRLFGNATASA